MTNNTNNRIFLDSGSKLSSVASQINITNNSWIIAPTGSGKSFFVANCVAGKRIIAVPTTGLADQFHFDYGATRYYSNQKDITNADFIAVTYDSLPSLFCNVDISQYKLFVDEAHNLVSSSSKSYRWKAMLAVRDILPLAKSYHLVTATPLTINDPMLSNLVVNNVISACSINKQVNVCGYTDINASVKSIVDYNHSIGNLTAVLFNNTRLDGALGKLVASLGSNVVTINSKKKDSKVYNDVVINGIVDTNTKALISTTVLKEGNSIKQHTPHVTVIICGVFHPSEIEQFCARFRNATTINVILMRKSESVSLFSENYLYNNKESETICDFDTCDDDDYSLYLQSQINPVVDYNVELPTFDLHKAITRRTNTAILNMQDFVDNYSAGEYKYYSKVSSRHFRSYGDRFILDHLAIANDVYEHQKSFAHNNYDYMTEMLFEYSWINYGIYNISDKLTDDVQATVDNAIADHKQTIEQLKADICTSIANQSQDSNDAVITTLSSSYNHIIEREIREKVSFLNNFTISNNDSLALLNTIGHGKRAWTNFVKHASMKKALSDDTSHNLATIMSKVTDAFSIGDSYTSEYICTTINSIINNTYVVYDQLSKTKCSQILNLVYNTSRTKKTVDGNRINAVKIKSDVYYMDDSCYSSKSESDTLLALIQEFDLSITFA